MAFEGGSPILAFDPDYAGAADGVTESAGASNAADDGPGILKMMEWFGSESATQYFGRAFSHRLVALAWILEPGRMQGKSLAAIAKSRGMSPQALSKYAAEASRIFSLRNRSQCAHGKRWKKPHQRPR